MDVLSRLADQYDRRIGAQAGPLVLAREIKTMDERLAAGRTSMPGRGTLSSCGGVFSQLGVMHDGTIVPCTILSVYPIGKIGEDRLQDVWLHHPTMVGLRRRRDIPLRSLETCRDCHYQGLCAGGCPAGAVYAYGNFNMRNPMDCFRVLKGMDPYFKLAEEALDHKTLNGNISVSS
jgi:radical SAM protein with 4Fe4S-binding SPASM domain